MTNAPSWRELHNTACKLYDAGFNVIPLNYAQKTPAIKWKMYQTKRSTPTEIYQWWSAKTAAQPHGIGVVAGIVGKIAILDFDPATTSTVDDLINEAEHVIGHKFPETCRVQTCGGGYHDYYTIDSPINTTDIFTGVHGKIQLRGDGTYVVAPPSTALSNRTNTVGQYNFIRPIDTRVQLNSTWLADFIKTKASNGTKETNTTQQPTPEDIKTILNLYNFRLSQTAHEILKNEVVVEDRSALCYWLACEIVRCGITNPRDVATIILAAPQHADKFGTRPQNTAWNAWDHAQRLAEKALNEITPSVPVAQISEGSTPTIFIDVQQPDQTDLAFPRDAAVGICADIAQMFSSHAESPYEYWYMTALTCLGSLISGGITIDTIYKPQPRLYTVLVGPSGIGRKSAAIHTITKFMTNTLETTEPLNILHGVGSAEGLAKVMKRDDGELSRLLLVFDEIRVFIRKARAEGSVLMDMVNTLFELNYYANATKHDVIKLTNAHLSLLGAATEDMFIDMWSREFITQGFLNRLVIVPGRPNKPNPLPENILPEQERVIAEKLRQTVDQINLCSSVEIAIGTSVIKMPGKEAHKMGLTDAAKDLWRQWYLDWFTVDTQDPTRLRLDTLGMRLMILQEISRGNTCSIEADTVNNVLKLLKWQHNVRKAYAPAATDTNAASMEESIKRVLYRYGHLTKRDLRRRTNADRFGLRIFQEALNNLTQHQVIHEIQLQGQAAYRLLDI